VAINSATYPKKNQSQIYPDSHNACFVGIKNDLIFGRYDNEKSLPACTMMSLSKTYNCDIRKLLFHKIVNIHNRKKYFINLIILSLDENHSKYKPHNKIAMISPKKYQYALIEKHKIHNIYEIIKSLVLNLEKYLTKNNKKKIRI